MLMLNPSYMDNIHNSAFKSTSTTASFQTSAEPRGATMAAAESPRGTRCGQREIDQDPSKITPIKYKLPVK